MGTPYVGIRVYFTSGDYIQGSVLQDALPKLLKQPTTVWQADIHQNAGTAYRVDKIVIQPGNICFYIPIETINVAQQVYLGDRGLYDSDRDLSTQRQHETGI